MGKKLISLIVILLLLLTACGKEPPTKTVYLLEEELEYQYFIQSEKYEMRDRMQYTYSDKGHLQKMERFLHSGSLSLTEEYECDEKGQILRKTVRDKKGKITEDYRYTYDENGNTLTEQKSTSVKPVHTIQWTYDEQGRILTEENTLHTIGNSVSKKTYSYKAENGCNTTEEYEGDTLVGRTVEQLDENGRVQTRTITTYISGEAKDEWREEYTYEGNIVREKRYNSNQNLPNYERMEQYDENGNLLKREDYTNFYDEGGNLVKQNVIRWEYRYRELQVPA